MVKVEGTWKVMALKRDNNLALGQSTAMGMINQTIKESSGDCTLNSCIRYTGALNTSTD